MSRDFKQEYEQHMNEQTPDLWARIEANLPVKEVPEVTGTTVVGFDVKNNKADTPEVSQMRPRKGISRTWLTYAMTAAAALLICVLAVPVLRSAQGGNSESANFMAKDAAMPEMVMEDGAADAGAMDNGMKYSADGADGAVSEMMAQEAECEVEEEMVTNDCAVTESVNDSNNTEAASGSTATMENEKAATTEVTTPHLQDEEESKVVALTAEIAVLETFKQDGKVLYKADIAGQEAIFILGEAFSEEVVLSVGEMYELSLEAAEENMAWDYVIIGIE